MALPEQIRTAIGHGVRVVDQPYRRGQVTHVEIAAGSGLDLATVNGVRMPMPDLPTPIAVGDWVLYLDHPTQGGIVNRLSGTPPEAIYTAPEVPDPGPGGDTEEIYHYPASGNIIVVGVGEDLQEAINDSSEFDDIRVSGDHTADGNKGGIAGKLDIPHAVFLRSLDGTGIITQAETSAAMEGLWIHGLQCIRIGPVDHQSSYSAIRTDVGALTRGWFHDLEIWGHGYNNGIELNRRWVNNRNVLSEVEVHDIENKAFILYGDYTRGIGLHAHHVYRTVDFASFVDTDFVNYGGSNHEYSGCYMHDYDEYDSIGFHSAGRANPTGPLGLAAEPHPDMFQTFLTFLADNLTPWLTKDILIRDSVCYLPADPAHPIFVGSSPPAGHPKASGSGAGGRHFCGHSNHSTGGNYYVERVTVQDCKSLTNGTSAFVISGIRDFSIIRHEAILANPDTAPGYPTDEFRTYSMTNVDDGNGDGPDPDNIVITDAEIWRLGSGATSGQDAFHGSFPAEVTETGTTLHPAGTSPTLGPEWTDAATILETASDAEVESWHAFP